MKQESPIQEVDLIPDVEGQSYHESLLPTMLNEECLTANLLFLCAEPGMGKSHLANRLLHKAKEDGGVTYLHDYEALPPEVACRRLVRCCKSVVERIVAGKYADRKTVLVVIDGLAAGDEAQSHREAKAIRRLVEAGARVVVCLRPEAEQVVECMGDALCLYASDLTIRLDEEDETTVELAGGVPSLIAALGADRAMGIDHGSGGSHYDRQLADLIDKLLRTTLPDEELRVRLAMMLLGHGTMDELALVAGRCDVEQLQWLAHDVPLFGIDVGKRTFCCHGLSDDKVFDRCGSALCTHVAQEPQLMVRACGVLAARGDTRRSAMVSRLCVSESDHISVCAAWGVAFVGAGEAQLVTDAIKSLHASGVALGVRGTLSEAAAASVVGTARQVDVLWERLPELRLSGTMEGRLYQRVLLLGACRDILRNPRQAPQHLTAEPGDAIGLACLDHLKAAHILSAGRFEEAYATITNEMLVRDPESLPEALVCDDLLLALLLGGGAPDARERSLFAKAEAFFAHPGSKRMQSYHEAVAAMPAILMSSEHGAKAVEDAASLAERAGDAFFQALCLLVTAVADIRAHAYSRAHVRAARSHELFRAMGEEYLTSSSELVDAIARELLGDGGLFGRYCEATVRPEGLALLGRILARATGELTGFEVGFVIPMATPCPRSILWLINLLINDCTDTWGKLHELIPLAWVELLRSTRYRQAQNASFDTVCPPKPTQPEAHVSKPVSLGAGGQTEMPLAKETTGGVYVSVLGGFSVTIDGKKLPEGLFERRRARDLVTLLALVPGHKMRRYQAIEVLWPGEDYFRGPRKLYESTGEARKRLSSGGTGANAIISDRVQGAIGFDSAVVRCDIDEFESEARKVLMEDSDDFEVLDHARRMQRIYSTGPDEHLEALGELVGDRVADLRTMFVDAAVAAGEAALRLGKARLAIQYGTDAHRLDSLREDAIILLVRALRVVGRGYEIPDLYRRYSRHLLEVQGVPPSLTLRRVVECELGMGSGPDLDAGPAPLPS